jgi:hypothetical protein
MSKMTRRANKPYPEDLISPNELPDDAPKEHPIPWVLGEGGNGHYYLCDAKGIYIAHVYVWDNEEHKVFLRKLRSINKDPKLEI